MMEVVVEEETPYKIRTFSNPRKGAMPIMVLKQAAYLSWINTNCSWRPPHTYLSPRMSTGSLSREALNIRHLLKESR